MPQKKIPSAAGFSAVLIMIHRCLTVLQSVLKSPSETALLKVRQAVLTHNCKKKKAHWIVETSDEKIEKLSTSCLKRFTYFYFCHVFVVSGFDMMEAFGLTKRAHSSVEGVAAEPFVFNTLPTYTLYRDVQLTQSTKWDRLFRCF